MSDEAVRVSSKDDFVGHMTDNEDVDLPAGAVEELWDVWTTYHDDHPTHVMVVVPEWFASNDFDARRPAFFASVEHDNPDKGAILFADAQLIDVSILENQVWDKVDLDDTVTMLDMSEDNDYIDEAGLVWVPRSLLTVYDRVEANVD